MGNRFFAGVVRWGGFHVRGIADGGPWDPRRLTFRQEAQVDLDFDPARGDRKIKTVVELLAMGMEALATRETRHVWIHESLQSEAKTVWEKFSRSSSARLSYQLN